MDWTELAARPPVWADSAGSTTAVTPGSGASSPFIVATRFLTVRNYSDQPFLISASPESCAAATDRSLQAISKSSGASVWKLADCDPLAVKIFRERFLWPEPPSPLPGKKEFKYLALRSGEKEWTRINEVEHVAWGQVFSGSISESEFAATYRAPNGDAPWAWTESQGYLASDPGRIGSGLSIEMLVHLPGLALARRLPQAQNAMTAMGIVFHPVARMGAGEMDSALFWLKSRGGLGLTPVEVYRKFSGTVLPLMDWETQAQNRCLEKHHKRLEDRVYKSLHLLAQARVLTYSELLALGSFARMGAYLGILPLQIPPLLEELRVTTQPGHLQVISRRVLMKEDEDIQRANVVRLALERRGIQA